MTESGLPRLKTGAGASELGAPDGGRDRFHSAADPGQRQSLKALLTSLILLLALMAVGLQLVSTYVYREAALDQQNRALQRAAESAIRHAVDSMNDTKAELAYRFLSEAGTRAALAESEKAPIKDALETLFGQYFNTSGRVDLLAVAVFDINAQLRAEAVAEGHSLNIRVDCLTVLDKALRRNETAGSPANSSTSVASLTHLRPAAGYCAAGEAALIVGIGDLKPTGYLMVVTNPVPFFARVERFLDLPVSIFNADGANVYQSGGDWVVGSESSQAGTGQTENGGRQAVELDEPTGSGMTIRLHADFQSLTRRLDNTRNVVVAVALGLLVLIVGVALALLQRGFRPLARLGEAARAVSKGRFAYVDAQGASAETEAPIRAFNRMVASLERANEQRDRAEQRMIEQRDRAEYQARLLYEEKEFIQTTLQSIDDVVITVDKDGDVVSLNRRAELLLGTHQRDAVARPFVDVMPLSDSVAFNGPRVSIQDLPTRKAALPGGARSWFYRASIHAKLYELEAYVSAMRNAVGAVIGYVVVIHDVTEDRELRREMLHQAKHDTLTGLINRFEFEQRLEALLDPSRDANAQHALAYLDLDQFKIINDTCGHVAGDELLRQLARSFEEVLDDNIMMARLGGDEFGVLMECTGVEAAIAIAERLVAVAKGYRFVWQDKLFMVGVSIGLVEFSNLNTSADVLSHADSACYVAKGAGGNRVSVYQPDDHELQTQEGAIQWVSELNLALQQDRFVLFVQPIQALRHRTEARHFEVLLRYRRPDGTLVEPGAFLPAAERFNLAVSIDRWVVRNTLAWLARAQLAFPVELSINLSGLSLSEPDMLPFIRDAFADFDVDPGSITFEITETAVIANLSRASTFMSTLHDLGCRFALDDFGSGLSSFAYLKNLSVDYLKIDGMFVKDIIEDPHDFAMVKSIAEVGHSLLLKTVAEYVEDPHALHLLREINVDYAQGWGIGRPRPIDSLLNDDA